MRLRLSFHKQCELPETGAENPESLAAKRMHDFVITMSQLNALALPTDTEITIGVYIPPILKIGEEEIAQPDVHTTSDDHRLVAYLKVAHPQLKLVALSPDYLLIVFNDWEGQKDLMDALLGFLISDVTLFPAKFYKA